MILITSVRYGTCTVDFFNLLEGVSARRHRLMSTNQVISTCCVLRSADSLDIPGEMECSSVPPRMIDIIGKA